jgi:hypothetical protein
MGVTSSQQRRKTETAILDSRGRPVQLLYDEDNDKTIMARGNALGAAYTVGTTKICTSNSTTVNLAGGATFTGVGTDINGYATILVTMFSDQDGATDGLVIQFSNDLSDWHDADVYTYFANSYKTYSFQPVDQYVRIKYTNGAVETTKLHISTRLHSFNVKSSSHRMADDIKGQDDAELVKAILAAEKAGGTPDVYTNIQATVNGNLKVSIEESDPAAHLYVHDYSHGVANGDLPGFGLNKFGMNDDVGATFETVWDGNAPYVWPTTATVVNVVGGAQDVLTTGTGAWTVEIQGLDANYALQTETVNMAGAAGVNTTNTFIRLFRMKVLTAGTDGTNNAAITATINGTNAAIITAGYGQTLMALWTVPDGYNARLFRWYASTSVATKANETRIRVREFGGAWQTKRTIHINGNSVDQIWSFPLLVGAKADIEVQSMATVGGGDCAAGFDLKYNTV